MMWKSLLLFVLVGLVAACVSPEPPPFNVIETTIADIHSAFEAGDLTCVKLVDRYLARIEAYDQSTGLNAIVVVNPKAREKAAELDRQYAETGRLAPLHCVALIVKDNYDTHDLQTAAGSAALRGSLPPDDAHQVRVLREAGAVVIAKSNMAEWAFSPYQTESSLAGITRNPYDLERVPAGSSGGTAAAVATSMGVVGLGTDTGNSIRGPASHCSLVGIRPTLGLTSRDGIVPLYLRNDTGGPIARTVADAARILDVIAAVDPNDPLTADGAGKRPATYLEALQKDGLSGARIGVLRQLTDPVDADPEIVALFETAIAELESLGATIVDPFEIVGLEEFYEKVWCDVFRHDVNTYLTSLGPAAPVKSLKEVVDSGQYAPYIEGRLKSALEVEGGPEEQDPPCLDVLNDPVRIAYRQAVIEAMDEHSLDAVIYPSWDNPPRLIGDMDSPHGNNSPYVAPHTGQPALSVPMGFTSGGLPGGLQFLGRPYAEFDLIRFAYAYEQATGHRRPPASFGSLVEPH